MPIGISLPFAPSTGSFGYFKTTDSVDDAIKTNVLSLLVTNWGERPMHYRFGCNISEFIFENKTQELKEKIADRILDQFDTWLPYLSIDNLNILFSSEDERISSKSIGIAMSFSLKKSRSSVGNIFVAV